MFRNEESFNNTWEFGYRALLNKRCSAKAAALVSHDKNTPNYSRSCYCFVYVCVRLCLCVRICMCYQRADTILCYSLLVFYISPGYFIEHTCIMVSTWNHFPRYWTFVRGIHRSSVNPPLKGLVKRAVMFVLMSNWTNGRTNRSEAGKLRCLDAHFMPV